MSAARFTPGPWRWELNETHRRVHLVGGRPMYDLTILEPIRWGMSGATLHIRDAAQDGMNLMHKLHDRRDWIAPHYGRAHHVKWCADIVHPDMRLIAAAPDLVAACGQASFALRELLPEHPDAQMTVQMLDAAIAKATGAAS